jgi:hypothetical protein
MSHTEQDLLNLVAVPMEVAKLHALWGTYGEKGIGALKVVRLIDCSTDHLRNILNQPLRMRDTGLALVIRAILKDRGSEP